jgi:hypothetical protein
MKRLGPTLLILLAIVLLIGGIVAVLQSNSLRSSESDIRNSILQKSPMGSSISDVKAAIQSQPWLNVSEWTVDPSEPSVVRAPVQGTHVIVGYQYYRGLPWRMVVRAYWGFDSEGKLVDLRVEKWGEGI